jgi:hypothetical protein
MMRCARKHWTLKHIWTDAHVSDELKKAQCYVAKRKTKQSHTMLALTIASTKKRFPLPVDLIRKMNEMMADDEYDEWVLENQ